MSDEKGKENTRYDKTLNWLKNHPTFSYIMIICLFIGSFSGILNLPTTINNSWKAIDELQSKILYHSKYSDQSLYDESIKLNVEILDFVRTRRINEPTFDFNNWDTSVATSTRYNVETKSMFQMQFSTRINTIISEFLLRNIKDEDLNQESSYPVNTLMMEEIANRIQIMAIALKSK
jgi:hypothetical protein